MSPKETYKKDLLRQYLEGSISSVDRHELEKIALDDPFLFDAMEGASLNPYIHQANINDLQNKLYPRDAKVIRPSFWKQISVAAGVLVLVSALFFVNRQFDSQQEMASVQKSDQVDSESNELIQVTEAENTNLLLESAESTTGALEESVEALQSQKLISNIKDTKLLQKEDKVQTSSTSFTKKKTVSVPIEKDVSSYADETSIPVSEPKPSTIYAGADKNPEFEKADEIENVEQTKKVSDAVMDGVAIAKSKDKSYDVESNNSRAASPPPAVAQTLEQEKDDAFDFLANPSYGLVTDEAGEALIGANVLIVGTDIGIVTDFDGKFELPSDLVYPVILEVSYVGFHQMSLPLQEPRANISFALNSEGMIMDEVVVVGANAERKENKQAVKNSENQDISQVHFVEGNSFPEIGGTQFNKYFQEELERRNACMQQGTYQFKFIVKRNGKLSNVKLATPANVNCEDMLIEIFEKGGDWIPNKKQGKTYTSYTLKIQ